MLTIYCNNNGTDNFVEIYNGYICLVHAYNLDDISNEIWDGLDVGQQMTIQIHLGD